MIVTARTCAVNGVIVFFVMIIWFQSTFPADRLDLKRYYRIVAYVNRLWLLVSDKKFNIFGVLFRQSCLWFFSPESSLYER